MKSRGERRASSRAARIRRSRTKSINLLRTLNEWAAARRLRKKSRCTK